MRINWFRLAEELLILMQQTDMKLKNKVRVVTS